MEELCGDMVMEILIRLPARSLIQLKLTNKEWYGLISHPFLVKLHLERLRMDMRAAKILVIDHFPPMGSTNGNPLRFIDFGNSEGYRVERAISNFRDRICLGDTVIRGSCDGLICFIRPCYKHDRIILVNLSTKKFRDLPSRENRNCSGINCRVVAYAVGLGYDPATDDYKVVRAYSQNEYGSGETVVEVFALKGNGWKRINENPRVKFSPMSLYLNGSMYWLASDMNDSQLVLSFNLTTEKFLEVPTPETGNGTKFLGLGILEGCLLVYTVYWELNGCFKAWSMNESGGKSSWDKAFVIPGRLLPTPTKFVKVICIKNGKILFCLDGSDLILFDVKDGTCQFLINPGRHFQYEFTMYVESLISPYTGMASPSTQLKR
ncbi:hypothetical protein SAY86_028003 [Trapa natans]|uniref:F-box domain-containing protein n=1 Tax=Trapa natans TaxID=22666 RepID=A0AAN7RAC0_TRANT|nr:hypothetical protein SAY86_028003 [Trapa natans]